MAKQKKNGPSLTLTPFYLTSLKLDEWPTLRHVFMLGLGSFMSRNNVFRPSLSSIYFRLTLLNLFFTFNIFLRNPVFGVHPTPVVPKIVKILTVLEFDEIHLGN